MSRQLITNHLLITDIALDEDWRRFEEEQKRLPKITPTSENVISFPISKKVSWRLVNKRHKERRRLNSRV